MHNNKNNNRLDPQDLTDNSVSEDSINRIPNINLLEQANNFFNLYEHGIEDRSPLNENHNISSRQLLINNNDKEDFEPLERPTNLGTNEEKNNKDEELELCQIKDNKKYKFCCQREEELNSKNNSQSDKKLGRKKKSESNKTKGVHNKFADDNLRRKCKHVVLSNIMDFVNEKIDYLYNGDIGNNIFKKKFLTLNKNQKADATVNYNQKFLNKTLGEIFSDEISGKFTNYRPEHNKLLVKTLINEKDEKKRVYFNNLFKLSFLECLKHFRGTANIDELEGVKRFDAIKETLHEEDEYIKILEYYIHNFENIIMRKKARKSKTQKSEEEKRDIITK